MLANNIHISVPTTSSCNSLTNATSTKQEVTRGINGMDISQLTIHPKMVG
jgi:hypothetical protein